MMLEGTIELEFIIVIPTKNVVNLGEPLVVTEPLGDRLDFFEYPKALLVPALHPQHLDLGLAEVDPLLLALVGLREAIQAIDDCSAILQRLDRGEPSCRPLGSAQQILERLLDISALLVVMTQEFRPFVE